MSRDVMKLALEALESCGAGHISDGGNQWHDEKLVDKAITALREALAEQPAQQEPVADEVRCPECGYLTKHTEHIGCLRKQLNAINDFEQRNFAIVNMEKFSPAQRKPWVGLTDDEILYCVELENPKAIAEEVEAKLKEKNT